jgi:hypothetical protein
MSIGKLWTPITMHVYSSSCILYKKIMLTNATRITYHQDMLNLIKALHPLTIKMAKILWTSWLDQSSCKCICNIVVCINFKTIYWIYFCNNICNIKFNLILINEMNDSKCWIHYILFYLKLSWANVALCFSFFHGGWNCPLLKVSVLCICNVLYWRSFVPKLNSICDVLDFIWMYCACST